MYCAGLRPEEAVAAALPDCRLPQTGWGRLIVHRILPQAGKRWTDTGQYHDERGLKNRPPGETRVVPLARRGADRTERRALAVDWLDKVGLPDPATRADHYPHQLSGGQKQRAAIAMALATGTKLIVADEPTSSLDTTAQTEILDLLHRCRTDFGTALLLITHNMGIVTDLADRVAVIHEGRIVEESPARPASASPGQAYTRRLLTVAPDLRKNGRARRASSEQPVVRAAGLVVDYPGRLGRPGLRAVDGASFSIHPGEVLGLMGESGSGKTTIGRALAGLIPVSAGELHVLGEDLTARPRKHAHPGHIGYVFQDPATSFNPLLTVGESIAEPLTAHRHRRRSQAIRNRVESLLDAVHLPRTHANRYPHELSGGQRQRASLARALALRPGLLIADEPTSALDASVQAQVLDLFTELQRELGFAALFISHDRTMNERVADRVAILHRGKIAET